jgi:sterol 3beta-glucosyltransferase
MRAVLTGLGSMGDIQPVVALAVELCRHGHQPILALAPYFGPYVHRHGLPFVAIGPDLNYSELQRNEMRAVMQGINLFDLMSDHLAILKSMLPQVFSELSDVCYDADVLISGQLQMASRMIHELTNIPFVSIQTNHFGGKQQLAARQAIASVINPFREQYGLSPISDPIFTDGNSPQLALYAMSRYFRPPAVNWPEHYHVTGFFFLDDELWEPDTSLLEFIESGSPPVVMSFSSITHEAPDRVTELLLEAIRIADCRAIIQRGWSGLAMGKMPPGILAVDFVPHTWLFKHASCVVHHGGPGTMAAAVYGGAPAVIIPHIGDQPLWAELARDLGCAPYVIPLQEMTAERLGEAIATTLATPKYYRNVALVAEKIRAELGVIEARRLIERLISNLGVRRNIAPIAPAVTCSLMERVSRRKQRQSSHLLRKRSGKATESSDR